MIQLGNKIVVIGGGAAAINAVKAIREVDKEAEINVFQKENKYPYYRIRLTKGLFEKLEEDKILLQKKEWYEANNIKLSLGKEVVKIDTNSHEIVMEDGSKASYDKLLLTNGAYNFIPAIEGTKKKNIYTIRDIDNIQDIRNSIEDMDTILIIGGGIQGLETAWVIQQQGKNVIIAEAEERLMFRQVDEKTSKILQNAIEELKIKVLLKTQIERIIGEEEVKGVVTNNGGIINCDMIIYSIGIRANKELYKNTPIKTNYGVIVNERMQTNIENVYAAGDVAELNGRLGGLWNVAVEQGKTAGYNIAGKDAVYHSLVPSATFNAFNISLFSIGEVNEDNCTLSITDEGEDGVSYKKMFIRDNRLTGAIIIGDIKYSIILKETVEKKKTLTNIDLSNITVTDFLFKLKNI